ncbi:MAG: twin-arginine translocase TatA/TatE family subunit [Oligoflexia bacterium]|nr:twin-arginine translocase TatA/TatE family subunit [Oligoflexia bacterium]
MFGISGEHLLLVVIVLILFGPKKLPDLGHSIGRTMKNFKDAMNGSEEAVNKKEQITHAETEDSKKESIKEEEKV